MTAATFATRTEVEVQADLLVLLIREGWRPPGTNDAATAVRKAHLLTGISIAALRDADGRRERFGDPRAYDRPVVPGAPPQSPPRPQHDPSAQPSRWEPVERLTCSRCGHTKPDDEFAMCSVCRDHYRTRTASRRAESAQRETSHRALVRAVAPVTDLALNEAKDGFELVCSRCRRPIGQGEAVVCLSCAGGQG